MDKKLAAVICVGFIGCIATVTATALPNTPLYSIRMEQHSNKMGFLPTTVNGFCYTTENGCTVDSSGFSDCEPAPVPTGFPETCITCTTSESTCEETCPDTCYDTCPTACSTFPPTCMDTCPDTCWETCITCEGETCPATCCNTCDTCSTCEGQNTCFICPITSDTCNTYEKTQQ